MSDVPCYFLNGESEPRRAPKVEYGSRDPAWLSRFFARHRGEAPGKYRARLRHGR